MSEFGDKIKTLSFNSGLWRTLAQKNQDLELKQYAQARAEGSQPMSTKQGEEALRESDALGRAYNASDLAQTYHPEVNKELKSQMIRPEYVDG